MIQKIMQSFPNFNILLKGGENKEPCLESDLQ